MKFKFFSRKGEEVFVSENLEEVEKRALEYKKKENLKSLEICDERGKFVKWA